MEPDRAAHHEARGVARAHGDGPLRGGRPHAWRHPDEKREEHDMDFNDLTEEQRARAREAKTPEEVLALARQEGYELTDEQLEAVAGGDEFWCGSYAPTVN